MKFSSPVFLRTTVPEALRGISKTGTALCLLFLSCITCTCLNARGHTHSKLETVRGIIPRLHASEHPRPSGAATAVRPSDLHASEHPRFLEIHRIRVVNRYFGAVSVSVDKGASWRRIGRVLRPMNGECKKIGPREFTASDWAPMASVAATAVNAVHIKVDQLDPHAVVFSMLPRELGPDGRRLKSYFDQPSTIFLDIAAGEGIFGPEWAPTVGSPLRTEDPVSGELKVPPRGWTPHVGCNFVIIVQQSEPRLDYVEFENNFGGSVTGRFNDGGSRVLGRVLRPVTGVGRFGGTSYAGCGVLRANHPGVICLSTSPPGQTGGFQIIPSLHASDPELNYVRTIPVWMVLGPDKPGDPPLEGTWPLFRGTFQPRAWRLEVKKRGSDEFVSPPGLVGKRVGALLDVEAIALRRLPSKR